MGSIEARKTDISATSEQHVFNPSPNEGEKEEPNKHPTPLLFSFAKAAMKDQTRREERMGSAEPQKTATSVEKSKLEKRVVNQSANMFDKIDRTTNLDLGKVNKNAATGGNEVPIQSHSVAEAEKEETNKQQTPLLFSFAKAAMKDQTRTEERIGSAEPQENTTSLEKSKLEKRVVNQSASMLDKTAGMTKPDLGKCNKNAMTSQDECRIQSRFVSEAEKEETNKHQTPLLFSFAKAALKDQGKRELGSGGSELQGSDKILEKQVPPVNSEVRRNKKKRKQSRLSVSVPTLVFFDQSPGFDARAERHQEPIPSMDREAVERAYRLMDFEKPETPPAVFQVKI